MNFWAPCIQCITGSCLEKTFQIEPQFRLLPSLCPRALLPKHWNTANLRGLKNLTFAHDDDDPNDDDNGASGDCGSIISKELRLQSIHSLSDVTHLLTNLGKQLDPMCLTRSVSNSFILHFTYGKYIFLQLALQITVFYNRSTCDNRFKHIYNIRIFPQQLGVIHLASGCSIAAPFWFKFTRTIHVLNGRNLNVLHLKLLTWLARLLTWSCSAATFLLPKSQHGGKGEGW